MEMIEMVIEGEKTIVPDIKINDKISVSFDERYDNDFAEWLADYKGDLIVTEVDYELGTIWLKDCSFGVDINIVTDSKR